MKTNLFQILLWSFIMAGCDSGRQPEELLRDPAAREEIFSAISENPDYMEEFIREINTQRMHPNMGPMRGRMMRGMVRSWNMDSLMLSDTVMHRRMLRHMLTRADRDSLFCMQMGDSLMRHDRMRKTLRQRLNNR